MDIEELKGLGYKPTLELRYHIDKKGWTGHGRRNTYLFETTLQQKYEEPKSQSCIWIDIPNVESIDTLDLDYEESLRKV